MRTVWNNRVNGPSRTPPGAYRTQCKLCERAIFAGQPAVWLTRPTMIGLVHQVCPA